MGDQWSQWSVSAPRVTTSGLYDTDKETKNVLSTTEQPCLIQFFLLFLNFFNPSTKTHLDSYLDN